MPFQSGIRTAGIEKAGGGGLSKQRVLFPTLPWCGAPGGQGWNICLVSVEEISSVAAPPALLQMPRPLPPPRAC